MKKTESRVLPFKKAPREEVGPGLEGVLPSPGWTLQFDRRKQRRAGKAPAPSPHREAPNDP